MKTTSSSQAGSRAAYHQPSRTASIIAPRVAPPSSPPAKSNATPIRSSMRMRSLPSRAAIRALRPLASTSQRACRAASLPSVCRRQPAAPSPSKSRTRQPACSTAPASTAACAGIASKRAPALPLDQSDARESGKTTPARRLFADLPHATLASPDVRGADRGPRFGAYALAWDRIERLPNTLD